MSGAITQMGVLYGKLGLSTSAELIAARGKGVEAASKALTRGQIAPLVRCALGLVDADGLLPLAEAFSELDPTFDVRATDPEAALLCCSILALEMETAEAYGDEVALLLTAASFGGVRKPKGEAALIDTAEGLLANARTAAAATPKDRNHLVAGKPFTEALAAIPGSGAVDGSLVRPALAGLQLYAEARSKTAAQSDNDILAYVRRLEEELRTYWWVSARWCDALKSPFRDIQTPEAALRAGLELAAKTSLPLGLNAAPALADMVLNDGRSDLGKDLTVAQVATATDIGWRKSQFATFAESADAWLLPLSTALGLAAISEDANDWMPRFKRLTKIDPKTKIRPIALASQIYVEQLAHRLLG
jgi:GTPase-associated system helical domain